MTGSASTIGVVMFIGMMVLMALRMPIAAAESACLRADISIPKSRP